MVWTETTRARYERHSGRYASDLTDQEWGLIAPFLPPPKTTGRPRSTAMRDVLDAILYIASAGCAWRMLPNDFPPVSTVRYYFYGWRNDGIFEVISHFLVATAREFHGKKPGPTAGVIDSQTIKTTESGGISGYDAGKKTKGRKRHIVTDTLGFMVGLVVHSAGIQDRDCAPEVLKSIRYSHPNLRHIFADGGYAGPKLRDALEGIGDWTIQIVKRFDTAEGFEVTPRRWVVERTFAWLNRCRRLAKDWEKSIASSQAWILVAHIRTLTRKIARHCNHRRVLNQTLRYGSETLVKCIPHSRRIFVLGWIDGQAGLSQENELGEYRRALMSAFGGADQIQAVDAGIFINFLAELLHCQLSDEDTGIEYVPELALNYQLPGSGLKSTRKGLAFPGEPQLSVTLASLRKIPKEFRFALGHLLNGAPERVSDRATGPLLTSFTARALSAQVATSMMVKKRAAISHTETTQFAKFAIDLAGKKQEVEGLQGELEAEEKLFETIIVVGAYSKGTPDNSRLALTEVAKIYRYANFQLENDTFIQLPLFLSALPFGVTKKRMSDLVKLQRMKLLKGAAVGALLNVHGEFSGSDQPDAMLLVGRQGQIFMWDNFLSEGNYNVAVVGKSGAGKSVRMQEMVCSIYAAGGKVVVIDDGYSFQNTCEILEGDWVGFDGSREIKLNPFSMLDVENMKQEEYCHDAIHLVTRVIATMASLGSEHGSRVEEIEEDMIYQAVAEAWAERGVEAEISDVRDRLKVRAKSEDKLKYVVLKLDRFCPGGMYGSYFTGLSNLALNASFTVFELSDIKGQKGFEAVVLQLIMFLATELMYKTARDEKVVILIDEAWDLLTAPGTSKFIESVVRRVRKYTGALITGTQSVNDYHANDAAKVCFENSDWTVFLAQKPETIDGLVQDRRLGVSPYIAEQLKSLRSIPGQFSELAIKGPGGWAFGRLLLDAFSLAVFSSKGSTVSRIRHYRNQGLTMAQALRLVVDRKEAE